ncbi:hypothetical protein GIB67_019962 [Kingdonia uniflora]|uniref:CG-1 domain-containing protein n=1 Tax=Kingdonia uniflora TaxID=39325 RepID=A0A7J7MKM5_9MAGN|nr:hypothetical protein GIB67_019962 [Kingdonia uniflora]
MEWEGQVLLGMNALKELIAGRLGGSLFLYNKRVLRYFRKDGHDWRKKKTEKTVGERHEKLRNAQWFTLILIGTGAVGIIAWKFSSLRSFMENMCSSKWLIKSNGIQGLLLQVRQATKDGGVDRERDILEGIHLSDESSSGASLTSNLCEPDNIFSHLNTAAHKPSNKKPRKLGLVRIGDGIKIEEETGLGKTKSFGTKRGMKIELEYNEIGGKKIERFHCLHCHEGMDNIIRHNGIKHLKLRFICEVSTCLNAYRDKVLLDSSGSVQSEKLCVVREIGIPWSEEEHRTFLEWLGRLGKGD